MSARLFSLREQPVPAAAPSARAKGETSGTVARRGWEALALLLLAGAVFLLLALGSLRMDPHDPSLVGEDWMGPVGALIARVLVQGFGLVAWLVPVELLAVALPLFRGQRPGALGYRLAGDLVVAIMAASLTHVALAGVRVFGRAAVGGNVGLLFGELMRGLFSAPGSFLVGGTVIGLVLIGRSSLSFIALCHTIVQVSMLVAERIASGCVRLHAAWMAASEVRRERARALRQQDLPNLEGAFPRRASFDHSSSEESWLPYERTGAPPLALSSALSRGLSVSYAELSRTPSTADSATPSPSPALSAELQGAPADGDQVSVTPEPELRTPTPASCQGHPKPTAAALPLIVDTSGELQVKRGATRPARLASTAFELPSPDLLLPAEAPMAEVDKGRVLELSQKLEKTLLDYGVSGKVEEIHPGPTVTTYEVAPQAGTKVSRVASLSDDLALGLSRKVRIIAPIPGKSRIGFELPNDERVPVSLRELVEDKRFGNLAQKACLPVILGRDIVGAPFYTDLANMPHVIVAGATGAGKSVGLNVMLSSLLFCRTPEQLRLLMIDPKVVELAPFDGIPHMLLPVVTDMKQAATALRWAVNEMEQRYQMFATAGTKNITTYNLWAERVARGELPAPPAGDVQALTPEGGIVSVPSAKTGSDGVQLPGQLPYIVIVVDEFADLMMQQGKDVEVCVARLAQKARAAGMHVVLATQRPSVDVITGMIKANFPSRIAFRVAQKVDSRTILDEQGAEVLLGRGDMLVKLNGASDTRRVQCPFVSEEEVSRLTDFLRTQGTPRYHDAILLEDPEGDEAKAQDDAELDARFDEAVRIVAETQRCSTSWLQRKMTIGYNRAAKIVEQMEKRGMVGPPNGAKDREVLVPSPSF